jgi:tetratricopeptide (TPR) repeat protein
VKKAKNPPASTIPVKAPGSFFHPTGKWFRILLLSFVVFIVYKSVLDFKLVDWDDRIYLHETPMIKGLNWENVKLMFSEKVLRSYNPLVLLSFAADYEIANGKPEWCHGVNLFFHILNVLLVFACMKQFRFGNDVAGSIALLFGLHPLSVEAVAWVAGRKDMIYSFFYLLAWLFYLRFYTSRKKHLYLFSILFFVLSLFSKVQAITLPFVLILSEYMLSGEWKWKSLLNKLPFIILSIVFGIIAVFGNELVAVKYTTIPTFSEKIIYSIMAFGLYFQKVLVPVSQSAIYSFPELGSSEYNRLLITGGLTILIVVIVVAKTIKKQRMIGGGLILFVVSMSVVMHLFALNSALIYERFTYLGCLGIFISVACMGSLIPSFKKYERGILVTLIVLSGLKTYSQVKVWRNSEMLWSDVIEKNPSAADAYTNRGRYYAERGKLELALSDFNESIRINPDQPYSYSNRAAVYFKMNRVDEALEDNSMVLKIDSAFYKGASDRGYYYLHKQQFDSSIFYYNYSLKNNPNDFSALFYIGMGFYGKYEFSTAIQYFGKAIKINPDYADAYSFKAASYAYLEREDSALISITEAEESIPGSTAKSMVSEIYVLKGYEYFTGGNSDSALYYYKLANKFLPGNVNALYYTGEVYLSQQNVKATREIWKKVLALDPNHQSAREGLLRIGEE